MRYMNWDVLLFPADSRVPLQEFRTACHVLYDPETFQGQDSPLTSSTSTTNPVAQRQLPTVTCFVPHLSRGSQFRVSLHSWYEPPISRGTQATTSPNDSVLFEARVFLDGICAGYDTKEIAASMR
ncbi:hypothetical protein Q9189_004979 [Teloschistes chrysophthalmus]